MDLKLLSVDLDFSRKPRKRRKRKRGRKLFNSKDPRFVARRLIKGFLNGWNDRSIAGYAGISLSAYYRYMRKTKGKELLMIKNMMRTRDTRSIEERIAFKAGLGEIELAHIDLDLSKK